MAERGNTYDRILTEALRLFAARGFEATGVADISGAVGIKAPSLYKHFPSKQAIFDALVDRELARYSQTRERLAMGPVSLDSDATAIAGSSPETMAEYSRKLFEHWTTGDATAFRRMLSAERLRSPEMAAIYRRLFIEGPLDYQAALFSNLVEQGIFAPADPLVLAMQFWGPLLMLMELSDCSDDTAPVLEMLHSHVTHFGLEHARKVADNE